MGISVIVDDAHPGFLDYYGIQWSLEANSNTLFNRTLTTCNTAIKNTSTAPYMTFYFYGSDINIYGPVTSGVALNYTIDGTDVRPGIINSNATGKNNVDLWNLEGLQETAYHSVQIFPSAGQFSFDYLTYTANKYTSLTGSDLILDDAEDAIQYSPDANWTHTTGNFDAGLPYKGTMSGTNSQGATMKFDFVGASINVYGLLNQVDGKLSASFSVDGGSATTYTPFDGTQTVNASSWILTQNFFHQYLVPGNHSLLVTLEEATGSQKLWIDSLVFEGTDDTPINQTLPSSGSSSSSSKSSLSSSEIGGIVGGAIALFVVFSWLRNKFKSSRPRPAKSSNTARPRPPSSAPAPPPPIPQPAYAYAMVPQAEMARMNFGYANSNSGTPMSPTPFPLAQDLNYRPAPPPVDYVNNISYNQNLRPPGPGQFGHGSSSQLSFADSSASGQMPQSPPMPQPYAPQAPLTSNSPQRNDPKSHPAVLSHQPIATTSASPGPGSHRVPESELNTDPTDDPPPSYDEGF